jgi:hypothetical protein
VCRSCNRGGPSSGHGGTRYRYPAVGREVAKVGLVESGSIARRPSYLDHSNNNTAEGHPEVKDGNGMPSFCDTLVLGCHRMRYTQHSNCYSCLLLARLRARNAKRLEQLPTCPLRGTVGSELYLSVVSQNALPIRG